MNNNLDFIINYPINVTDELYGYWGYEDIKKKEALIVKEWEKIDRLELNPDKAEDLKCRIWEQNEEICPRFDQYFYYSQNVALWLYQNVEDFKIPREGLYGKRRLKLAEKLETIALNHNFDDPEFASIIADISAFLKKQPIVFGKN